eukprot:scaffold8075_cov136-Skeletonema_dohrnii-CCMP3373.AAC.4
MESTLCLALSCSCSLEVRFTTSTAGTDKKLLVVMMLLLFLFCVLGPDYGVSRKQGKGIVHGRLTIIFPPGGFKDLGEAEF